MVCCSGQFCKRSKSEGSKYCLRCQEEHQSCNPGNCTLRAHICKVHGCKQHRKSMDPLADRRRCDFHRDQLLADKKKHPFVARLKCIRRGCNNQVAIVPGYEGFATCANHGSRRIGTYWSHQHCSWTTKRQQLLMVLKNHRMEGKTVSIHQVCFSSNRNFLL